MMAHVKLGHSFPYVLYAIHERNARLPARLTRLERRRFVQKPVSESSFDTSNQSVLESKKGVAEKLGASGQEAEVTRVRASDTKVVEIRQRKDSELVVQLEREQRAEEGFKLLDMGNLLARQFKQRITDPDRKTHRTIFQVKKPFHIHIVALVLDAIEALFLFAFRGSSRPVNYFTLGSFAPVEEFEPELVLSVKGELPECLNGEFVRAGPNPRFKSLASHHIFDGDGYSSKTNTLGFLFDSLTFAQKEIIACWGMLHGLRIKEGKVTYVSRYVRTARLAQEEYWGGPKFYRIGDLRGLKGLGALIIYQIRLGLGVLDESEGKGTASTALVYHNGNFFVMTETDKPYLIRVLEDGDLETIARFDYDKKLHHSFTAHPKIDPDTGEMFIFGTTITPPFVTYRVVSKDGVMGDAVPITIRAPVMMHDFAITENYAIFMDLPLFFKPKDMVKKNQFAFAFDETKPTRFGVLPRYAKDESEIRWFELSSCVIFHNANAWEEGDEVIMISCRFPELNMGPTGVEEKSTFDTSVVEMWEYRFNMMSGKAVERRLGDILSDLPRINEDYVGRKNRYVYTGLFQDATRVIGVVKYDLTLEPKLGQKRPEVGGNIAGIFWYGHQRCGSEPVFVPKNRGREVDEDDGYVVSVVVDEKRWVSEVVVIDAKTMSPDPVAVIELPARIPSGFHGLFVSEVELQLQQSNR